MAVARSYDSRIIWNGSEVALVPMSTSRRCRNDSARLFVRAIFLALNLADRGVDASVGAQEADRWESCSQIEKPDSRPLLGAALWTSRDMRLII